MFQIKKFLFKFVKKLFIIVYNNENNVNNKFFRLIIVSSFKQLLEILKSHNYNLIFQFLYHFYKGINEDLNYIMLFDINRLFLKRYSIIVNNN